jgi:hypothetical protein
MLPYLNNSFWMNASATYVYIIAKAGLKNITAIADYWLYARFIIGHELQFAEQVK